MALFGLDVGASPSFSSKMNYFIYCLCFILGLIYSQPNTQQPFRPIQGTPFGAANPDPRIPISINNRCGPSPSSLGTRCPAGQCCSINGWCGITPSHCGSGCFAGFGNCYAVSGNLPKQPPRPINPTQPNIPSSNQPSSGNNSTTFNIHTTPSPLSSPVAQQRPCTKPRIRKEWRELTDLEKDAYTEALMCLKKQPSVLSRPGFSSPSVYDDFVYIHMLANDEAHRTVTLFFIF